MATRQQRTKRAAGSVDEAVTSLKKKKKPEHEYGDEKIPAAALGVQASIAKPKKRSTNHIDGTVAPFIKKAKPEYGDGIGVQAGTSGGGEATAPAAAPPPGEGRRHVVGRRRGEATAPAADPPPSDGRRLEVNTTNKLLVPSPFLKLKDIIGDRGYGPDPGYSLVADPEYLPEETIDEAPEVTPPEAYGSFSFGDGDLSL